MPVNERAEEIIATAKASLTPPPPILMPERCGTIIKGKRVQQNWFVTNQELATYLQAASGRADAYHCNATFPDQGSRKKNADCLYRSVWVDIDLPFDTALAVLTEFCATTETPKPSIVVSSGGGLHAYWVFTRDLVLDEWTRASRALNAFCAAHDLNIDNKCTVDAVRVLRPPETLNHKYDPSRSSKPSRWGRTITSTNS